MSGPVTRVAGAMLHAVPTALWRRMVPKSAIGVCYHMVSDRAVPHVRHYPYSGQAAFERDLDYLQRHFHIVSYPELAARRDAGDPARRNDMILTFDDGFAECATVVAPILRRRGVPAVVFVITDLVDNGMMFRESEAALCIGAIGRMETPGILAIADGLGLGHLPTPPGAGPGGTRTRLDIAGLARGTDPRVHPLLHWLLSVGAADADRLRALSVALGVDTAAYLESAQPYLTVPQIRQLHGAGITIGAHGCSHRWLQDLPQAEAEREIVESCRIVAGITGQASVPFAFPYFGGGLDRVWLAELRARHDFIGLLFDTDGLRDDAPFVVQRVFGEHFGYDTTLDATLRRAWARPASWQRRAA